MAAGLTDTLEQMLDGQADQIGARIGADSDQTRSALATAIPALMAALAQEANSESATGLKQAIERDHDGSILDDLNGYLGGTANLDPRTTNGAGILEHVLGDREPEVAQALSAKSGLNMGSIMQLLPILAPILLGMLGKLGKQSSSGSSGGGGFGLDDLGSILSGETEANRSKNPDIGDILDGFSQGGSGAASTAGSRSQEGGGFGGILDSILGRKRDG